ncbi:arylsulfatase [Porticoccaceae bacterium]|nr:arylsulfatase [Porticoccaceae bacterium]
MTVARALKNRFISAGLLTRLARLVRLVCLGVPAFGLSLSVAAADKGPNIVLILADDLGFTDLESYGSEIKTPSISALAEQGISFTNYHTGANCAPSRSMLLTGVDSHRTGVPNIPEMLPPEQSKYSHYAGTLGHNVVTVATLLQDAGYHTYLAGKWHLGQTPDLLPSRRGFERTVALGDSGADNWEQKPYMAVYDKANWYADGQEYQLPDDFYSSRFLVDKTIEFIDSNQGDGQPFFAYVPFQAVHIPVQAPQEFIDRYMGVYDGGWQALREQRLVRAIELGIVPADSTMITMASTQDWDSLSPERQAYEAKRMAVYGAMVEAMDHHIGRLVEHLKAIDEYDNTLFIFTSDNGAEVSGLAEQNSFLNRLGLRTQGYSTDYESLGLRGSFNSISPSFASAAASPLAYYKFYVGEGGMRVPMIIAGAGIASKKQMTDAFAFVTDITPTILALSGVDKPGVRYGGRPVEPIIGRNLLPLIEGETEAVYGPNDAVGFELAGHAVLFMGDYKIVFNRGAQGDSQWRLFNIRKDPGETTDLSTENPVQFQLMLDHYEKYVVENNVLPISEGYDHTTQVILNGLKNRLSGGILIALLLVLLLLPFIIFYRTRRQ